MTQTQAVSGTSKPIDKYIPWFFVAFFATFIIVDAIFVTVALDTNTGVVTEHAYEQGLHYDAMLDKVRAQEALGWQGTIDYAGGGVIFSLQDDKGADIFDVQFTTECR